MRVELHIERLVLDGLAVEPHDADAVRDVLSSELGRLLAEMPSRSWQDSRRLRRLAAPEARLSAPGDVTATARGIARSVAAGLSMSVARARPGGVR